MRMCATDFLVYTCIASISCTAYCFVFLSYSKTLYNPRSERCLIYWLLPMYRFLLEGGFCTPLFLTSMELLKYTRWYSTNVALVEILQELHCIYKKNMKIAMVTSTAILTSLTCLCCKHIYLTWYASLNLCDHWFTLIFSKLWIRPLCVFSVDGFEWPTYWRTIQMGPFEHIPDSR